MVADPYSICTGLIPGYCAVSNGSVCYNSQGLFGWVLSASDGEHFTTGMGTVRSPQPTSFRAEGYALLSLVLYPRRVAESTSMHETWIGAVVTNSKSLLQTVKGKPTTPIHPGFDDPILLEGKAVRLDVLQPTGTSLSKSHMQ
jgi:hypothetical protein